MVRRGPPSEIQVLQARQELKPEATFHVLADIIGKLIVLAVVLSFSLSTRAGQKGHPVGNLATAVGPAVAGVIAARKSEPRQAEQNDRSQDLHLRGAKQRTH
jgi:hypothetical protein